MDLPPPIPLPDLVLPVPALLPRLPLSLLALELANPLDVVCRLAWEALLQVLVDLHLRLAASLASLRVVSPERRLRDSLAVEVLQVDPVSLQL